MAGEEAQNPVTSIKRFFAQLNDDDCTWLTLCCSSYVDDDYARLTTVEARRSWLDRLLGNLESKRRFGEVVHVIAILDFELSPFALSRRAAEAHQMTDSTNDLIADAGNQILQEQLPRLGKLVALWKDFREHELDEASLWVYRDEMQHQQRQIWSLRSPPKAPS